MNDPRLAEHVRVPALALRSFIADVLTSVGVEPHPATIVADVLVAANLRGVDSHGVALLGWYLSMLDRNIVEKRVNTEVLVEEGAIVHVDARNSFGAPVSVMAMDKCLELAETNGIACVSVRNSNHFGMAAYYPLRALPKNMIGLAMTNASRLVAPTYGTEPMLGTNPIAVAVPAGREFPFVLDMATSVRPFGKAVMAQEKGELLPAGVAIDQDNESLLDPAEFIKSVRTNFGAALLPLGGLAALSGYKGYGLAMLVDILSGVLSGSNFSKHVASSPTEPAKVGHWFMAIKVENFLPLAEFKARMDHLINELKSSRKAVGQSRIYIPGEIEFETEIERSRDGIPLSMNGLKQIREISDRTGTAFEVPS